ncbi:TPA: ead/Ea22-like family protein [Klebsiella variicola]
MTDITELAQRMKAAAEKATHGQWLVTEQDCRWNIDDESGGAIAIAQQRNPIRDDYKQAERTANAEFIALANPANILALVEAVEKSQQRIAELESSTVKLPVGWQFEECEIEGCENGAIFSVGTGSRNIHLCDKCAHEPQNSRLKKSPLSKRLPFKMSAGIKMEVE